MKKSKNFNPRSRKGSDLRAAPKDGMIILFQSTLPQGERHRAGSVRTLAEDISIHAPARGATRSGVA